ncbi:MAG: hypothetical protein ACRDL8_11305 [Solirubrobacteraceae bacterium]
METLTTSPALPPAAADHSEVKIVTTPAPGPSPAPEAPGPVVATPAPARRPEPGPQLISGREAAHQPAQWRLEAAAPVASVEIGTIEVRLEPPAAVPAARPPAAPQVRLGFDDYLATRSYSR